jgi:hypothetical protein
MASTATDSAPTPIQLVRKDLFYSKTYVGPQMRARVASARESAGRGIGSVSALTRVVLVSRAFTFPP